MKPNPLARLQSRVPVRVITGVLQLGLVATVVALLVYLSRAPDVEKGASLPSSAASAPRAVKVIKPQPAPHTVQVATTGTVTVRNYVALAAETTGRVVWVAEGLRSGGTFKAGEELLRVDSRDHELAHKQALADLKVATAALVLREAESKVSIRNYELLHPGEAVPDLVARVPQIEQAKAQIAMVEARVASTRLELSRTTIHLPFDGHVLESQAEVGQVLTRNQPFGRVFASDSLEVLASISASELALLESAIGRIAAVSAEGRQFEAMLSRISPELDHRTRMASIFLTPNVTEFISPGTFVNVVIEGPRVEETFLLPEAAEQSFGEVWFVRNGQIATFKPRTLVRLPSGSLVAAFDYGEGIVVGSVAGAQEGSEVSPIEILH